MKQIRFRHALIIAPVMAGLLAPLPTQAAWRKKPVTAAHHKNFAQRHPTMTSFAAGYAAYKAAKITGKRRQLAGGKKNFAQRHPFLTGMGAGMATHHVIKKSMKNR